MVEIRAALNPVGTVARAVEAVVVAQRLAAPAQAVKEPAEAQAWLATPPALLPLAAAVVLIPLAPPVQATTVALAVLAGLPAFPVPVSPMAVAEEVKASRQEAQAGPEAVLLLLSIQGWRVAQQPTRAAGLEEAAGSMALTALAAKASSLFGTRSKETLWPTSQK